MKLALLGDIHASRYWVAPWRLIGKRFLGQMNVWINPQRRFRLEHLAASLDRAVHLGADMFVFSGDLTCTTLPEELRDVTGVIRQHTRGKPIFAVPGNHDRYTLGTTLRKSFEKALADLCPMRFPQRQVISQHWSLIGLDASRPTVVTARGRVGSRQLEQVESWLAEIRAPHGVMVVCHYPLATPPDRHWRHTHRLADARALRQILETSAARVMYVHGHVHRPWCWMMPPLESSLQLLREKPARVETTGSTQAQSILAINTGSPTQVGREHPQGQGFWLAQLPEEPTRGLELTHHQHTSGDPHDDDSWVTTVHRIAAVKG